jgi:hypothetical protein
VKPLLRQAPEPEGGVGGDPALAEHDLEIALGLAMLGAANSRPEVPPAGRRIDRV